MSIKIHNLHVVHQSSSVRSGTEMLSCDTCTTQHLDIASVEIVSIADSVNELRTFQNLTLVFLLDNIVCKCKTVPTITHWNIFVFY